MSELEQAVAILKAKDDIRELTARYCWFVARSDGDRLALLFAEDGVIHIGSDQVVRGRAAIAELVSGVKPGGLIPVIHNHIIDVDGDDAKGTCVVESQVSPSGQGGGFVAYYRDEYRKVGGRWLFASRRHSPYVRNGVAAAPFD